MIRARKATVPVLCTAEVTPAGFPLSLHLTRLVTWWVSVLPDGTDGGCASARAGAQQTGRQGAGRRTRIALCSNGDLWLAILGSSLRDRRPVGRPQCLDVPALQDDGSILPARSSATEGEGMKLTG